MERRAFTDEEKALIARGWAAAREQGTSQDDYARQHRTTARRVRQFVAAYAPACSNAKLRSIVVGAITQLQSVLSQLDEPANTALSCRTARQESPPVTSASSTRQTSRPSLVPLGAPPPANSRRSTFKWDLDDAVDE
jgi:hypothetical protein